MLILNMEFDSDDNIEIYTFDIDSIKPVDCIENYEFFSNEWFDDLKDVIHYVEFMSPSEMIDENHKEPHIDLFDGSKWVEVTSLDVLDKEYVESLLYQLNEYYSRVNVFIGKNMITMYIGEIIPMFHALGSDVEKTHKLIMECHSKNKIQALALLYAVYHMNTSLKFVYSFHNIYRLGEKPFELNHEFQREMLYTFSINGELENIKTLLEFSQLSQTNLGRLFHIPELFLHLIGDLESISEETYKEKSTGFETFILYHSIKHKQFNVMNYLINKGANPHFIDKYSRTALHYALETDNINIILSVLRCYNIENNEYEIYDINVIDKYGNTCLDIWLNNPLCINNSDGSPNNILTMLIGLGAYSSNDLHLMEDVEMLEDILFSDDEVIV